MRASDVRRILVVTGLLIAVSTVTASRAAATQGNIDWRAATAVVRVAREQIKPCRAGCSGSMRLARTANTGSGVAPTAVEGGNSANATNAAGQTGLRLYSDTAATKSTTTATVRDHCASIPLGGTWSIKPVRRSC